MRQRRWRTAALTVETALAITQQPMSQSVCEGGPVTFDVTAGGTPPLSYQWRKDGGDIPGATNASLTIDQVTAADAGVYDVVVTNTCGEVTSDPARLTIIPIPAPPMSASANPNPACAGVSVTLSASGGSGGAFKWYEDGCGQGESIGEGRSIPISAPSADTTYYVRVEDACGNSQCASVTLTVDPQATAPSGPQPADGQAEVRVITRSTV